MQKFVRRVTVFLSSPSDLRMERQIADEIISHLNQDIGRIDGVFLESWKWETHSNSSQGRSAQDIINEQVGEEYDVFLGMLWSRFGTPAGVWGSGTEAEFRSALARRRKSGEPEIIFFFSEQSQSPSAIDTDQLRKVQDFKRSLGDEGVLFHSFDSETSYRRLLYRHLLSTVREILRKDSGGLSVTAMVPEFPNFDPLQSWNRLLLEDGAVSSEFMMAAASDRISVVREQLRRLTDAISSLALTTTKETKRLTANSKLSEASVLRSFKSIIHKMNSTNGIFLSLIPDLSIKLREGMEFSQRSITIKKSLGILREEDRQNLSNAVSGFRKSMESGRNAVEAASKGAAFEDSPFPALVVEGKKLSALMGDMNRVLAQGVKDLLELEKLIGSDERA